MFSNGCGCGFGFGLNLKMHAIIPLMLTGAGSLPARNISVRTDGKRFTFDHIIARGTHSVGTIFTLTAANYPGN